MQDRIDRFRRALTQILESARTCDSDLRKQYLALADEMQSVIEDLQKRQDAIMETAEDPRPRAAQEH